MAVTHFVYRPYPQDPEKVENAFAGRVLETYSETVRVMSDIWETGSFARVWDDAENKPKSLMYAMTGSTHNGTAVADADEATYAKYQAYLVEHHLERLHSAETRHLKEITFGSTVTVAHGRSYKGLTGKVAAIIYADYRMGYKVSNERKLGIPLNDEHVMAPGRNGTTYKRYLNVAWVWARNVEVVIPAFTHEELTEFRTEAMVRAKKDIDAIRMHPNRAR